MIAHQELLVKKKRKEKREVTFYKIGMLLKGNISKSQNIPPIV